MLLKNGKSLATNGEVIVIDLFDGLLAEENEDTIEEVKVWIDENSDQSSFKIGKDVLVVETGPGVFTVATDEESEEVEVWSDHLAILNSSVFDSFEADVSKSVCVSANGAVYHDGDGNTVGALSILTEKNCFVLVSTQ